MAKHKNTSITIYFLYALIFCLFWLHFKACTVLSDSKSKGAIAPCEVSVEKANQCHTTTGEVAGRWNLFLVNFYLLRDDQGCECLVYLPVWASTPATGIHVMSVGEPREIIGIGPYSWVVFSESEHQALDAPGKTVPVKRSKPAEKTTSNPFGTIEPLKNGLDAGYENHAK